MAIRSAVLAAAFCSFLIPAFGANVTYLALGDSIAFGYSPLIPATDIDRMIGYPEVIESTKFVLDGKDEINLSCPGDTSGSFFDVTAPDNHCRDWRASGFPLHTKYSGTQLEAALDKLKKNKKIDLVTISLGGNDLLLLENSCKAAPDFVACVGAGLGTPTSPGPVLVNYARNLSQILGAIRASGYKGRIILVSYYSPNYNDTLRTGAVLALNAVISGVASGFNATVSDAFTTFAIASAFRGGDTCAAGLLVQLSPGSCDVHPSELGRNLLAATVVATMNNIPLTQLLQGIPGQR